MTLVDVEAGRMAGDLATWRTLTTICCGLGRTTARLQLFIEVESTMAKRNRRIYYAHAMCVYNSAHEANELVLIRRQFRGWMIVNPGSYEDHPAKLNDTMGFCCGLVERCQTVVFSRLLGRVTSGVGKEVNHALRCRIPVFEIVNSKLVRRSRRVTYISRAASRSLYRRWRRLQWGYE